MRTVMPQVTLHIGFDDTDSTRKGCTTYIAAILVEKLHELNARFIDYPNLIRLNPNVPWKTRGNGALCLRVKVPEADKTRLREMVVDTVERHSDLGSRGTDPGIVFLERASIPQSIRQFASNAITGIVTLREAKRIISEFHGEAVGFKQGRGIIGALAAIGEPLEKDHTYEILAYRLPQNCGTKRMVNDESIFRMDKATAPLTFNNVDLDKRRLIITPRGPDPILFGIRGETADIVKKAFDMVKTLEPVERWVVFRTNQGTDAHLKRVRTLNELEPFCPAIVKGTVCKNPTLIRGRHAIFSIEDESGSVDCAAYEPTGSLRKVVQQLIVGDKVEAYGGVKAPSGHHALTVNLEKVRLLNLIPLMTYQNPICRRCGKRLKSMGKGQGYRCERCGLRYDDLKKVGVDIKREIRKGLFVAATRSQRHLTKPLSRYGLEKRRQRREMVDCWHFP